MVNFGALYERKLLLALKQCEGIAPEWILLGGKKEQNEDDRQCLTRELTKETRNDVRRLLKNTELFGAFIGIVPNNNLVLSTVYTKRVEKILKPHSEIQEIKPFSYENLLNDPLVSEATRKTAMALYEK